MARRRERENQERAAKHPGDPDSKNSRRNGRRLGVLRAIHVAMDQQKERSERERLQGPGAHANLRGQNPKIDAEIFREKPVPCGERENQEGEREEEETSQGPRMIARRPNTEDLRYSSRRAKAVSSL